MAQNNKQNISESQLIGANIEKAYGAIENVLQEICLAEQRAIQGICLLLEKENIKFNSATITDIIAILLNWNKIPARDIEIRIKEMTQSAKISLDE